MKPINSQAIVLGRTNFSEADRILTVLTPDHGKIRLMAKGVRKIKSKLAGGIELFGISDITFIKGKGEIDTLISSRLKRNFDHIVNNLDRTMLGYEVLKKINKITEDGAEPAYFELLSITLEGLDDDSIPSDTLEFWFTMQLLNTTGHAPSLRADSSGLPLSQNSKYTFDYDTMAFQPAEQGIYQANHIKLLSLGIRAKQPAILTKVQNAKDLLPELLILAKAISTSQVHI